VSINIRSHRGAGPGGESGYGFLSKPFRLPHADPLSTPD
jgi:hypothetical protein